MFFDNFFNQTKRNKSLSEEKKFTGKARSLIYKNETPIWEQFIDGYFKGQEATVSKALIKYGTFGISQGMLDLDKSGVKNLSAVISKLRKKGIKIDTTVTAHGTSIYTLKS